MSAKRFELTEPAPQATLELSRALVENIQTALLLSLLKKNLLTQRQFDQCLEMIKDTNA